MPKELTYGTDIPYGTPEEPLAASVIELTWSREHEHVQIATRCLNVADHSVYEIPAQDLAGQDISRGHGNYVTLDRYGINNLIRNLRRARNQALGRDE